MARQTQAVAALTRRRVIDAAIAVFCERGIRDATLADVASRAGVTRGAVYGHFAGKPALVAAIIDALRWPLDVGDDLEAYLADPRPLRRLHAQLHAQMMACLQAPAHWRVVMLVLRGPGYLAWPQAAIDRAMALQARARASLNCVMDMARARHQLHPNIAPEVAARCLHALGAGLLSAHANAQAHDTHSDVQPGLRLFFEAVERGVAVAPHEAA